MLAVKLVYIVDRSREMHGNQSGPVTDVCVIAKRIRVDTARRFGSG